MRFWAIIAIMALTFLFAGCEKNNVAYAPANSLPSNSVATSEHVYLDHAQPKLPTIKLWVGAQVMEAEIAADHTQISTGMMYRKEMGTNDGMLFVFGRPILAAFYMRNTIVPLSAAYIDPEGTILEIHDLKPLDETPIESNSDQVQYVLETPQGWFKRNNVGVGALIRSERGSLEETFFGKNRR